MPVWKTESGITKVVGSYAELKELSGVELEDYHRPWIDDVTFEIDGETYTRIDKVMDSWFEAGSMPFAQFHYPFENKESSKPNFQVTSLWNTLAKCVLVLLHACHERCAIW